MFPCEWCCTGKGVGERGCLPAKDVCPRRMSAREGCLPAKDVLRSRDATRHPMLEHPGFTRLRSFAARGRVPTGEALFDVGQHLVECHTEQHDRDDAYVHFWDLEIVLRVDDEVSEPGFGPNHLGCHQNYE